MIQDIGNKKFNNQYDPKAVPTADSYIFFIENGAAAIKGEGSEAVLPRFRECPADGSYIYLFSIDEETFFLASPETPLPEGYYYEMIRGLNLKGFRPQYLTFAAYTALHLQHWYSSNRFCGCCGGTTELDHRERALHCTKCGRLIYPRLIPAVIVGVLNGDRLLLTKYARTRGVAYNALIAGFTEIGETLEECVAREVMEEVGLKVKNIRYYKSQPWGIVDDLLVGFYCDVDGDDTIRLDETELREGSWVKREDVVLQPENFSLTNEMMIRFKNGLENEPLD